MFHPRSSCPPALIYHHIIIVLSRFAFSGARLRSLLVAQIMVPAAQITESWQAVF